MRSPVRQAALGALAALVVAVLTACGGTSGTSSPPPPSGPTLTISLTSTTTVDYAHTTLTARDPSGRTYTQSFPSTGVMQFTDGPFGSWTVAVPVITYSKTNVDRSQSWETFDGSSSQQVIEWASGTSPGGRFTLQYTPSNGAGDSEHISLTFGRTS